jgi:hypothetical protein
MGTHLLRIGIFGRANEPQRTYVMGLLGLKSCIMARLTKE